MPPISPIHSASQTAKGAPLACFAFEPFEAALVSPLRHLLHACRDPQSQSWHRAFIIAAETWGETKGLAVAYALWPVVRCLHGLRGDSFNSNDPLDLQLREFLTQDEAQVIAMIQHMRRDETALARDAVDALTEGRMDPDLIRAALSFADRFPSGARLRLRGHPPLRAVS